MLTGKHVRVRFQGDRIVPWYLDARDPMPLELAEQLRLLYKDSVGQARGALEEEIDTRFGNLPQPVLHQGLAKLLEDRCDFEVLPGQPPEQVREAAFRAAAAARKAGGSFDRAVVLQRVGAELGLEPALVEAGLFADLKSEQRLVRFDDITAERLVERYNVALAQAVLLRSVAVDVVVRGETPRRYRQLFRQIKFRRLLCEVETLGTDVQRLRLDGPLSLFSATQKYGLQLALFLPTLLLCGNFTLDAELRWGANRVPKRFVLTPADGLVTHQSELGSYVPPEVDMFVELFRKKVSDWDIRTETEVIPLGRHFWVPDFRLVHRETGGVVLLDVLGFWRRSSVERHLDLLRTHATRPYLVALGEQLRVDEADLDDLPAPVMRFRNLPLPEEVARRAAHLLFPNTAAEPA
jgi:predicted nuclease of restriction endonuclease-like RecB superfamily